MRRKHTHQNWMSSQNGTNTNPEIIRQLRVDKSQAENTQQYTNDTNRSHLHSVNKLINNQHK